jgi:hypothetical protein
MDDHPTGGVPSNANTAPIGIDAGEPALLDWKSFRSLYAGSVEVLPIDGVYACACEATAMIVPVLFSELADVL